MCGGTWTQVAQHHLFKIVYVPDNGDFYFIYFLGILLIKLIGYNSLLLHDLITISISLVSSIFKSSQNTAANFEDIIHVIMSLFFVLDISCIFYETEGGKKDKLITSICHLLLLS